jgi:hypothetical protein
MILSNVMKISQQQNRVGTGLAVGGGLLGGLLLGGERRIKNSARVKQQCQSLPVA